MGEVYLGFDAELSRPVALKRVRPERGTPDYHERLRREAQALARLSHPNVVQVYQVGVHAGDTFVVMEYVEGQTLAEALALGPSWREVLRLFMAAGRGLAAAHAVGLVHRDFKPDNVLVGADGRARVADFGLALTAEDGESEAGERYEAGGVVSDGRLTRADAVVGTIRYMSLEQLRGEAVDAATDQFAFCVALYEALYGAEPFELDSLATRIEALEADQPRIPRAQPRSVWPILRRGLRSDPHQRWPDLDALLLALGRVERRRRWPWVAGLATVALAAGLWAQDNASACAEVEDELIGVWDASARVKVAAAFDADGRLFAKEDSTRVEQIFDDWSQTWIEERRDQCEAAFTRRDAPELSRVRRVCLDRQRHGVAALVRELAKGEPAALEQARATLTGLAQPSECRPELILAQPRLDGDLDEGVIALRNELETLRMSRLLGQADMGRSRHALERARELGFAAAIAEAQAELGRTQLAVGRAKQGLATLEASIEEALRGDHDRALAGIYLSLATNLLTRHPDNEPGQRYLGQAEALWSRLEPDLQTRARLSFARARAALAREEPELARAALEAALELHGDTPSPDTPIYLGALAQLEGGDEGLALQRQALRAAELAWGPDHPKTAAYLEDLGDALYMRELRVEARVVIERAANILLAARQNPQRLAAAHELLARLRLDDYDRASDEGERARVLAEVEDHAHVLARIYAETLPARHPSHGDPHQYLSRVAALRGDEHGYARHILANLEYWALDGPNRDHVLQVRYEAGVALTDLGQLAQARLHFDALLRQRSNESLAQLGGLGLAELALRRGRPAEALEILVNIEASELGVYRVTALIIRALAEHRVGCDDCRRAARAHVEQLRDDPELAHVELEPWLEEFALDASERTLLAPLLTP